MKKFLLLAALVAASPALSKTGPLVCALDHEKGDIVKYMFDIDADGDLVEKAFMKNGKLILHEIDERPVWAYTKVNGGVQLRYLRDERFTLVVRDYTERNGRFINSPATLRQNGRIVATGQCGYEKV